MTELTVKGEDFTVGQGLRPAVATALPQVVSMVREAVEAYRLADLFAARDPIS